jgi:acyl-CoA dehydrogenase
MALCLKMIRKPVLDQARFSRVFEKYVYALKDTYAMDA